MSSEDNFDSETFILEVNDSPAISDISCKEYSNRDLRKKCWLELVNTFNNKENATEAVICLRCCWHVFVQIKFELSGEAPPGGATTMAPCAKGLMVPSMESW
jgi:hypothetical protein